MGEGSTRGDFLLRVVPLHVQVTVMTTLTILYLIVAFWVKAVVMFSVLVCTVYVSTVLTAREPANRDREEKKETMKWCPGSSIHKQMKQVLFLSHPFMGLNPTFFSHSKEGHSPAFSYLSLFKGAS